MKDWTVVRRTRLRRATRHMAPADIVMLRRGVGSEAKWSTALVVRDVSGERLTNEKEAPDYKVACHDYSTRGGKR